MRPRPPLRLAALALRAAPLGGCDGGPAEAGGGDPAPVVLPGRYDADGAPLQFPGSDALTGRVDADGDLSGSGSAPFSDLTVDLGADAVVTEGSAETPAGSTRTVAFDTGR